MKKGVLLMVFAGMILSYSAQSQIYTKYSQHFEVGEANSYYFTGPVSLDTTLYSDGSRSIHIAYNTSTDAYLYLDTIDLSDQADLQYATLEFMHICKVNTQSFYPPSGGMIEVRRVGTNPNQWTQLQGTLYDTVWGGGSIDFALSGYFTEYSYQNDWNAGNNVTPANTWWKKERFKLSSLLTGVSRENRKLIIRFHIPQMQNTSVEQYAGWYLDNIVVKASASSMTTPTLKMVSYPMFMDYPYSRDVKIVSNISTSALQGMNPDSIYIEYKLGASPIYRVNMVKVSGTASQYAAYIPFCGYDTIVSFRIMAKDSTSNENYITFPQDETAFSHYRCVRGVANENPLTTGSTSSQSEHPFPAMSDAWMEYVYDQSTLRAAGYSAGAITKIAYKTDSAGGATINGLTIKLQNVDTSHTTSANNNYFTGDMVTVFSGNHTTARNAGTWGEINIDTFYYAGGDLLMHLCYDNSSDPRVTVVNSFPTVLGKESLFISLGASSNLSGCNLSSMLSAGNMARVRPNLKFTTVLNQPLKLDLGIDSITSPATVTAANTPTPIVVRLRNYGTNPVNGTTIYFQVDNNPVQSYNWTGTVAGLSTTLVTVTNSEVFSTGFKHIKAWTADSLTVSGARFRDHEPLNDTAFSTLIACNGPMSGTRQIGGTNPNYNTIDEFIEALTQCGVDGPLTVNIAPGIYNQSIVLPAVTGISATNTVTFKTLSGDSLSVTIRVPSGEHFAVNMDSSRYITFIGIRFETAQRAVNGTSTLIQLSANSHHNTFTRCTFVDSTTTKLNTLIDVNSSSNITVDRCNFYGGVTALKIVGPSSANLAVNNVVRRSYFDTPKNTALLLENQNSPVVDSNTMYDAATNSVAVMNVVNCFDSIRITRNRIYSSQGAIGLKMASITGDTANYALVANNMVEAASTASSGFYYTPVEILDVENLSFVYNSVNLNIPNRTNISAAVLGGSGRFTNVRIINNIFDASAGTGNYTLSFNPMQDTTNVISHNNYHNAVSYMLNQFNGLSTPNWQDWINYVPQDSNSLMYNPVFLRSFPADLRTYNNFLHGVGIALPETNIDIEGQTRLDPPCMGAFEFPPLSYNLAITEMLAPEVSCTLSTTEHFKIVVGNTGVETLPANSATLQFQLAGGAASTPERITRPIPSGDTIHFTFTNPANLSSESHGADSVFYFRFWPTFASEVDFTNDTLEESLLSLYQLPKLPAQNITHNYATPITLNVNSSDSVYWYHSDSIGAEPFYRGRRLTTGRLYTDTTFYVAHFHEEPVIKITEVQINKQKDGVTYPYPSWMSSATNFAVEISNLGNYEAKLAGDTITTVSNTANYNNKWFVMPTITLPPYSSIVVQYSSGSQTDSVTCYYGQEVRPQYNTKFGVLYKRKGVGLIDAVAINDIVSQSVWTNLHIPASICSGYVSFTPTSAGIRRINPTDNTPAGWIVCGNSNRMTLGSVENSMIMVPDNGCKGYRTPIRIRLQNVPAVNIGITSVSVPNEGCSLYNEPVTISLTNLGTQTASNVSVKFKVGNRAYCTPETVVSSIGSYQTVSHTFSALADLSNHSADTLFTITASVVPPSADTDPTNDTLSIRVPSLYTPNLPNVSPQMQTINYASTATIRDLDMVDTLVWYDKHGTALDTGYVFTTPALYQTDTFYVTGLSTTETGVSLGNAEASSATSYPSPYYCGIKYRREQYLITADELRSLGYSDRPIKSIAFYLDSVRTVSGSTTFTDYTLSIGTTSINEFTNSNSWQTVTPVFTRSNFTISNANKGWVEHPLNFPLVWDGISNVVIQVCYTVQTPSSSASVAYTTTSNNSVIYSHSSSVAQCMSNTVNGRSNHRPDIRFGFATYNCQGLQRPVYVNVIGAPLVDASLLGVSNIPSSGNISGQSTPVKLTLKNYGTTPLQNVVINWDVDGGTSSTYNWSGNLNYLDTAEVYVGDFVFGPGRHCVNAYLTCAGDSYAANDTMQSCMLFCFDKTPRTIGNGGYFASFAEAVDALNTCGVCDSVTLVALPGSYNEQVLLSNIPGVTDSTPVMFCTNPGTRDSVVLYYSATSASDNYVLKIDNISNITFNGMTIAATGSTFANAVVVSDASKIHLGGDSIAVNNSANTNSANAITLSGRVANIDITNNVTSGGYYSVANIGSSVVTSNVNLYGNKFTKFHYIGINMQSANGIDITYNKVLSDITVSSSIMGIRVTNYNGAFNLQRNQVVLSGTGNGVKHGIELLASNGSSQYPIRVFNNMVSVYGDASNSNTSAGIYYYNSHYINTYYNTVRMFAGSNTPLTRGLEVVSCLNVKTMNNIFANLGQGYACYVDSLQSVASSNYNDYYTTGSKFVYWNGDRADTTALRAYNNLDAYSFKQQPFFISPDDLHLAYSTIVESGQYTNEVTIDIDSNARPQNFRPCVGAHEIPHLQHDVSVDNIIYPVLTSTQPVESEPLMVIARFYNNGRNTETNITWHAQIVGYPMLISPTETISQISIGQYISDTTYINMPLGLLDTQSVKVCLSMAGDEDSTNNCRTGDFKLYPAYDLSATRTNVTTTACRMTNVPISITVTNVGRKPIPTNFPMEIGYEITLLSQGVQLRNIPFVFVDTVYLPQQLARNNQRQLSFRQNADMYPWDTLMDVQLSVRSWAKLLNDLTPGNDTTPSVTVTSKHTPATPVGVDQTIPYATLVTLNASQSQNRPLRWSKDSTSTPFFAPSNYNASTTYSHPNLLFRDTIFYLSSISSTGCTSYYAPIHVYVNNPLPYDASVSQITEPLPKVYMDYDTVKVRIKNYGTQILTSTPVKYNVVQSSTGAILQSVSEICTATISPQGDYLYKFNTLPNFPDLLSWQYQIIAWTDLQGEMTRSNDTARKSITPLPESTYCIPEVSDTSGLDISRVTFAGMDNSLPSLGRKYVKLIDFDNPLMDPVELHRSTVDTLFITCENFENPNDSIRKAFVTAYIDWNRNGVFETGERILSDSTMALHTLAKVIRVPSNAYLGHSRMRIILEQTGTSPAGPCVDDIMQGEIQDYLINVTERPDTDAAILRILSPDNPIITASNPQRQIMLKVSNLGGTVIDTFNIAYSFASDTGVYRSYYQWTGSLQPNAFVCVTLPAYTFSEGTTVFNAQIVAQGDQNSSNNSVQMEFHRFHVVTLIYDDDFEASDMLFAPRGTNQYNQNLWQKGTPNKNSFAGTTSGNMAWVTDSVSPINVRGYGNKSYLYTPLINISQIKPDTIKFDLAANFVRGTYMYMEYLNYLGKWVRFGNQSDTLPWYTSYEGFSGNHNYVRFQYPLTRVSNDFSQEVQLRFVFLAKTTAGVLDGCAIDDLEIGRAKRAIDAGVTGISLLANEPRFGQTIAPRVMVKNFGYDTITSMEIVYHPEGSALPKKVLWEGSLPPDQSLMYRFSSSPFIVQRTMPDTFTICAYTIIGDDIYTSNDSTCRLFGLKPLQNDAGLVSLLTPAETVVANDSLQVSVRLKNYGQNSIASLPITYVFNRTIVTETINFTTLTGNALESLETFNYTFNRKVKAPIGNSVLKVFTGLPNDDYIYNDSLTRHISTAVNLVDLKAAEIVLNEYEHNYITVELAIDNLGARGASNFTVNYYYDNDTSTLVSETCTNIIPALSRGYHVFNAKLPKRPAPYSVVKAFISIDNDSDPSNDTTETFGTTFTDLAAEKVLVEENENSQCRVFLKVKNTGNLITTSPVTVRAVINGTQLEGTRLDNLFPGLTYNILMSSQVPKNGNHQYSGTASVTIAYDNDPTNNQTSVVERSNYVGIPFAEAEELQLFQNMPNPFVESTDISFELPSAGKVRFFVINTLGEMVHQSDNYFEKGKHIIAFNKGNLTAGTYFYGIEFEGQRLMRKMILNK